MHLSSGFLADTPMMFRVRTPSLLVVDDFYREPDAIRAIALEAEYEADTRYFKGLRSKKKFLFPWVKEEFERLLGVQITDWMDQPANGSFQKTSFKDPLVWHSDTQNYAAAIYLTPVARESSLDDRVDAGTSFWRHALNGSRRPPPERATYEETYSEHNLTHPDAWELVDRIGSVYNRLVLWDAQLIHSASSYEDFTMERPRLVQLFFFNVAQR